MQRFKDEKSFVYLRFNWVSTSQKLLNIAATLAEKCRQSRSTERQVLTDFAPAFNTILTSLEVSGAYLEGQWIRIVTDHEVYGGKFQRSPAHNRPVLTALKWLINCGYLKIEDGKRTIKQDGSSKLNDLPYAYVITNKWLEEIADKPISEQHEIVRNPLATYLELRKKVKPHNRGKERSVSLPISHKDRLRHLDLIEGTQGLLKAADSLWQRVSIHLGKEVLPSMQASMTRIFNNGSFMDGGRFYCSLQNLPKNQRKELFFNGEPTLEIDFAGLHPHMMYHLQAENFSGDPYEIKGFSRDAVKVGFNTLINRDSRKHKGSAARSLAMNLDLTPDEALRLENYIYKLHSRIAGHFNTGYGLKLQRLDSQIAYEVMKCFFVQLKRPVLMIHDSAIVSVRDTEALKLSMVDAYSSEVFKELEKNKSRYQNQFAPLPAGLKIVSADFTDLLTSTIYKALEGVDIATDEWDRAIKLDHPS
jgi:hypothetical protein